MEILEIILATIIGTTLMTLFSYLMSAAFRKLFVEPALLNFILKWSKASLNPRLSSAIGWLLHYAIGLLFVLSYHWIWAIGLLSFNFAIALLLGALSGILGIVSWMFMFRLSDKQPKIHFKAYYLQLFFAHVIFAISVFWTYSII